MLSGQRSISWFSLSLMMAASILFMPGTGIASRYHVKTTGTRTVGASLPNDWSDSNCFASLALAGAVATSADSLLLSPETHLLDTMVGLTSFLGNQDLDANNGEHHHFPDLLRLLRHRGRFLAPLYPGYYLDR